MTNTAPMALMAAALILAVQGGGTGEARGAECPCVFTAEKVPLYYWKGTVGCSISQDGKKTTLALFVVPSPRLSPSFVADLFPQGYCIQRDNPADPPSQRRQVKSDGEVKACSQKIIEYAQKLKDSPPKPPGEMVVLDISCELKK